VLLHVVIFYITHLFFRFAQWVTVIAGILDTAHYPKIKKIHFTCRISFNLSSPSLFHLNIEADPVPERWDYFKAQKMGNV
jgi:hypothetical protein